MYFEFFSAAWKIIKGWLPAGAVKKIKFLSKANIGEYVAEDQRPLAWAGKAEQEYAHSEHLKTRIIVARFVMAFFEGVFA
jgi:hypothetical protein